jgi:hypothetical protein
MINDETELHVYVRAQAKYLLWDKNCDVDSYILLFLSILRNNYIFLIRRGCFQADNSCGIYTGDFKAFDRFIALMKSELVPVQLYLNTN